MEFLNKLKKKTKLQPLSGLEALKETAQNSNHKLFIEDLWKNKPEIHEYLSGFILEGSDKTLTTNYVNDSLTRYMKTLEYIPAKKHLNVLELGANPYFFSILAKKIFSHDFSYANFFAENVYETKASSLKQKIDNGVDFFDFESKIFNLEKTEPYPYENNTFDVVLCCEILEHLILNPFNIFKEIHNILKPGGKLILTTPNAIRLTNVAAMLAGQNIFDIFHPVIHGRHNREYEVEELVSIIENHRYKIELVETHDRFDYDQVDIYATNYCKPKLIPYTKKSLNELLTAQNLPVKNRGDNIYIVASKNS